MSLNDQNQLELKEMQTKKEKLMMQYEKNKQSKNSALEIFIFKKSLSELTEILMKKECELSLVQGQLQNLEQYKVCIKV